MVLVLHACLPTFGVVIVRHVEAGGETDKKGVRDTEGDIRNTHKVIIGCLMAQS